MRFLEGHLRHSPWKTGFILFLLVCLALPRATASELPGGFIPAKLAEIDAVITNAIAEKRMPGAVFWLERNGQVYCRVYGNRALLPAVEPMTEDTIFDVASLTKVMATAPAIMLLVERGQINLDDPVQKYLPDFKGQGRDSITLRQLMTHVSGLPAGLTKRRDVSSYAVAIETAVSEEPKPAPLTVFRYSDVNFILLGHIVQKVTGLKLNQFVEREIFQPLKMNDTCYLPSKAKADRIAPTTREGARFMRGTVHDPKARAMGGVAGHAGVFGTVADLARYARMMINNGELEGVRILKEDTVKLMTSVQSPTNILARRGLGWDIDTGYSRRGTVFPIGSYGHTGFTGTCIWIDPFSKTFWILFSNRVHPDGRGNILSLQSQLGTLAAEAVEGFDFTNVPGALPPQLTNRVSNLTNTSSITKITNSVRVQPVTPP